MQDKCLNCETSSTGNYCPECGQKKSTHRFTFAAILHDIPHSVFHVDKGLLHTFIALLIRPGKLLKDYIAGKRASYFAPFAYLFFMTALSTFLAHKAFGNVELPSMIEYMVFPKAAAFFGHYPALILCTMIPIISLWSWLFNLSAGYNYWEHFVMNTYLAAQFNLFFIANSTVQITTGIALPSTVPIIVGFMAYLSFAYVQFFKRKFSFGRLLMDITLFLLIAFTLLNCLTFTGFMTKWWWW